MGDSVKIVDGSIILSYSFIYDEESISKVSTLPKIENLLSYADRIFEKNRIYKYDNIKNSYFEDVVLRIDGAKYQTYKLRIEDINILFFQNNTAILYIKIKPSNKDLTSLYKINRALTQFYAKQKSGNTSIYFGKEELSEIKISQEKFKEHITKFLNTKNMDKKTQNKNKKLCEEMLNSTEKSISKYTDIFTDKSIKLAKFESNGEFIIKITPLMINEFTQTILDYYYPIYTPYISDEIKEYPLSSEKVDDFRGRVGIIEKEKEQIRCQDCKRHYLYFEKQLELVNKKKEQENKFEFVHYDTFITSLILKYVAVNTRLKYYDNFNPISTSYINSYITLVCDGIADEYKNNFILFEPLLNSKGSKGENITNSDFFNVYQSQADMFTLGNSHSIVHILDKRAKDIKNNKETTHFYTYMLTTVQRNFILNIISSSIVNINNIDNKTASVSDIWHTFKQLSNTLDKFNMFLTNYNFKVISNNSSVDNSYNFFRECNEVDKLTSQWSSISSKMNDWKSILSHILQKRPVYLFVLFAMIGIIIKTFNHITDNLFSLISSIL